MRVQTSVTLLQTNTLSNKYPWERYEPPYPPSYGLNSTITVLWEGWYAIKKANQTNTTKDTPIECIYSIVHDNGFTITSGNSLRMMNLLIQWITWNYELGLCWRVETLLRKLLGQKLQGVSGKVVEKLTRHKC